MADPTNARQRSINSFFDSPRFAIKELPAIPDEALPLPAPPPTVPAAAGPALTVSLEPAAKRTLKGFLGDGLLVKVAANRPLTDLEVRLFEVLSSGRSSQPRSIRPPIGVTVRSISWSSEPARVPLEDSITSRLRIVIGSISRPSAPVR